MDTKNTYVNAMFNLLESEDPGFMERASETRVSYEEMHAHNSVHAQIPYSEAYTNSVMVAAETQPFVVVPKGLRGRAALNANNHPVASTIRVLPAGSNDPTENGMQVPLSSINPLELPSVDANELPLPLDDERRIYGSIIHGVKLTHPGGWLEGGLGPSAYPKQSSEETVDESSEQARYTAYFLRRHKIGSSVVLQRKLAEETNRQIAELRSRMAARQKALEKNREIDGKIEELTKQWEMERRIYENARARRKEREQLADG